MSLAVERASCLHLSRKEKVDRANRGRVRGSELAWLICFRFELQSGPVADPGGTTRLTRTGVLEVDAVRRLCATTLSFELSAQLALVPDVGPLLNHLISAGQQRGRQRQPQRLGGFLIDDKLELGREFDRKV